jgi:circadian clock protein KaiC
VIRNLKSVGIRLDRLSKAVLAHDLGPHHHRQRREFLVRIKALAREHKARCLVIDPVSTWPKPATS